MDVCCVFNYFMPTKVLFGEGQIKELGKITSEYGKKAMLVTSPWFDAVKPVFEKTLDLLKEAGVETVLFDKVLPNPTTSMINEGVRLALEEGADVVVGVGGGSSIDTAKAIAVGVTHPGTAWDYLYFKKLQPTVRTLPVIAVTTTSGTGSHVTKVSVMTDTETECKSAICHPNIFPRVSIVDPELMYSMPAKLTASTGFDAFTHACESYININSNIMIDDIALKSMGIIVKYLPKAVENPHDIEARRMMAYADTLAGITIANVGTTMPHALGQPISGHFPKVSHGEALALVYPAFFQLTWRSRIDKFAKIAGLFNPKYAGVDDNTAAVAAYKELVGFLEKIGMTLSLDELGVSEDKWDAIIDDCCDFPDLYVNPVVPTREQLHEIMFSLKM